jgi:hypothetical protein
MQRFLVRLVLLQIQMRDLFAFAYVQFVHSMEQIQSVVRPERCLLRINDIADFDTVLGKKLLRLGTGRSTSSMIAPIYAGHCKLLNYDLSASSFGFHGVRLRYAIIVPTTCGPGCDS